jgi:hypothetical protein
MKPTLLAALFILISAVSITGNAQNIYAITVNTNTSGFPAFASCTNCVYNISSGVTLTVNSTAACTHCTFNGGTVSIVSPSSLTLNGLDSFKNSTVLINQPFSTSSPDTLVFYGDSVAFNTTMSLNNGRTTIDSSKVAITAGDPLTLYKGTFSKDSLHLNANLTLSNTIDTISNSNVSVASGVTINANQTTFISSTLAFAGSSSMTVSGGMNSSNSNYYLAGTSTINSTAATNLSGDNIVESGTTNNFTSAYTFTANNTNFTLNGSAGKLTASQGFTTTGIGGSITAATGSTITSAYTITLTNETVNLTGTTFTGSQGLTTSGGSFSAASSTVSASNAVSLTNTPTTITSSTFSGQSLTTSGGTFKATSSTVSITNAISLTNTADTVISSNYSGQSISTSAGTFYANNSTLNSTYTATFSNTQAKLVGNTSLTAQQLSLQNGTWFAVGDGTLGSTANINLTYSSSEDATSTLAIANNNNYLKSSTTGTGNCGGAYPHACASGYVYGCATITNGGSPVYCTVLAIASMNLSAAVTGPGQVALTWTDNETSNAEHYTIQRNTGNNAWTDIGTTTAGNTTGDYYFTDANAPAGNVDYRIQRTDADGNILYSPVASVNLTLAGSSLSIHPNPAIGGRFYINTPYTGEMVVNVYTSTGQLLLHTSLQGQTQYSIQLPEQNLSMSAVVVQTISQNGNGAFTVLVR